MSAPLITLGVSTNEGEGVFLDNSDKNVLPLRPMACLHHTLNHKRLLGRVTNLTRKCFGPAHSSGLVRQGFQ